MSDVKVGFSGKITTVRAQTVTQALWDQAETRENTFVYLRQEIEFLHRFLIIAVIIFRKL